MAGMGVLLSNKTLIPAILVVLEYEKILLYRLKWSASMRGTTVKIIVLRGDLAVFESLSNCYKFLKTV